MNPCVGCGTTAGKAPQAARCDRCADEWLAERRPFDGPPDPAAEDPSLTSLTSLTSQSNWPEPIAAAGFHGLAGEFVQIIEPHSEADPAALLANFLVGAGNGIGDGPHDLVEADRHPARLFAMIVGATSHGRKGTSSGRAREALTFSFAGYKERIVNGLSSGEGLIHHVRDPEPESSDDDEDKEISDRRLLVLEGEFAQVLRASTRNGNTLSVVLRNLWDSGDVRVLTRNSPLKATGAHVSIIGHITTEELATELTASDTANGFANRFLWICARRSKLLPDGGDLDSKALMSICRELEKVGKWAATSRAMRRDNEARDLWHLVYPELSTGHPGAFGKATSRAEAQVLRLSVLYAALDRSTVVTVQHLSAALAVWAYAEDSARVIFGESLGNRNADRILRALKQKPNGLTRTEIIHLFDRHLSADQLDDALALLASQVRVVKVATGGRPAERVQLREVSEVSDERPGDELRSV